uniref:Uncharacterized protein n=1 Tax=Romanomermis culicivorax TaxID=13658 RepID=A0A915K7L9_ROMCU
MLCRACNDQICVTHFTLTNGVTAGMAITERGAGDITERYSYHDRRLLEMSIRQYDNDKR